MNSTGRILRVVEWRPLRCSRAELSDTEAEQIARLGNGRIALTAPSVLNEHKWEVRSEGWVGFLPVGPELALALEPKTSIGNLFRMFEYAYRLDLNLSEGAMGCESLTEFYERLAHVLALRVLDRVRRGIYAAYVPHEETISYLRGRMDLPERLRRPWSVGLRCRFEEHTADLEENQLLAWTLDRVARSGLCSGRVLPTVRRAYHSLHGRVSLRPFDASACIARLYNRLNDDYAPLHALCRFFLEHTGPAQQGGDHRMLPFLVDMERLFELFVAEWLRKHLPTGVQLKDQHTVHVDADGNFSFRVDIVLVDSVTGRPRSALDTKYKRQEKPSPGDIYQAVTYAESLGCHDAALIYPTPLSIPLDQTYGRNRVRSLAFDLGSPDLELSGRSFLAQLGVAWTPA